MKLTKTTVADLIPAPKAYEKSDTEIKGFLVRVQPTGRKTFYYQYRNQAGKKHRIKLGQFSSEITVAQAREKAKLMAADVAKGFDPQEEKKALASHSKKLADSTLVKFLEMHYDDWSKNNLKTGEKACREIRRMFVEFLSSPMLDITVGRVEKWRTRRLAEGAKPATLNRAVNDLRGLLRRANEWGFIDENPLRDFRNLKVDSDSKVRYLNDDEKQRLMEALQQRHDEKVAQRERQISFCKERNRVPPKSFSELHYVDRLEPMVVIALKTGLRRGELFDLMWADLDFDSEVITVRGEVAKSGNTRRIPMHPDVVVALSNWREQNVMASDRVFPGDDGGRLDNVKTSWTGLLKRAGISDFRWHDMRHDFASQLVMKGVPLNTVREFMGHSDMKMTLRYAHLAPDHKKDAISVL